MIPAEIRHFFLPFHLSICHAIPLSKNFATTHLEGGWRKAVLPWLKTLFELHFRRYLDDSCLHCYNISLDGTSFAHWAQFVGWAQPTIFHFNKTHIFLTEWSNPLCKEGKGERGKRGKCFSSCFLPDSV